MKTDYTAEGLRILRCRAGDGVLEGEGQCVGAEGSHDDVVLEVRFSPQWRGTTRTAQWFNAVGGSPVTRVLTADLLVGGEGDVYRIPVPAEAKELAGNAFLTIRGVVTGPGGREKRAVVTATARFRVLPALWSREAVESAEPAATVAEQIQAQVDALRDDVALAVQAAEAEEACRGYAEAAEACRDEAAHWGTAAETAANRAQQVAETVGESLREEVRQAAAGGGATLGADGKLTAGQRPDASELEFAGGVDIYAAVNAMKRELQAADTAALELARSNEAQLAKKAEAGAQTYVIIPVAEGMGTGGVVRLWKNPFGEVCLMVNDVTLSVNLSPTGTTVLASVEGEYLPRVNVPCAFVARSGSTTYPVHAWLNTAGKLSLRASAPAGSTIYGELHYLT